MFKKISGISGYEVVYGTDKKLKKDIKVISVKKNSVTIKNLDKKKYYVKVRAYKKDSPGRKTYGKYSKILSVKMRKK